MPEVVSMTADAINALVAPLVATVEIDGSSHLIITEKNGTVTDLGVVLTSLPTATVNSMINTAIAPLVSNVQINGSSHLIVTAENGTATDLGPILTSAPNTTPAYRFDVTSYGAKGTGKLSNTGATTVGSNQVTIGEAVLTSADNGKLVMVKDAYNTYNTAGQTTAIGVMTVVNSTTFTATFTTFGVNPTQTATGLQVLWADDDTVAIQAAIAAANTYALAHAGYAEIYFPTPPGGLYYGVGGALKTTDGAHAVYNSQLTIPVNAETNMGITLIFRGTGGGGHPRYWNSDAPAFGGGIVSFGDFSSAANQTSSVTNNGNPSVIGGPTGKNGYGVVVTGTTPTFTNTAVEFRDLTIRTAHSNSGWTYSAANMFGVARFHAENFSYGTVGIVQFYKYTPSLGDFTSVSVLSAGISIGLLLPSNGNNASNYLKAVVCDGGYTYGLVATEHTVGNDVTVLYCWSGVCPVGNYGDSGSGAVSALHASWFDQLCVEGNTYDINVFGAGASGIGPIMHAVMDTEGTIQLRDNPNNGTGLAAARGEIKFVGSPSTITPTFATGFKIIKSQNSPGVFASPPALVASTAVMNSTWRPATVYLVGGTTVTTIQVSSLAGSATAPAVTTIADFTAAGTIATPFPVRLGPGQWIKVNCATLPTAIWDLD